MFLGWGSLLLDRIRSDFASMHERIFFGLSLGMALCVGLVSLVGLLGIAYPAVLLLLLVGLWGLRKVDWKAAYAQGVHWPALLFSPTLVMTLYPPTVWDDISFHLPIAQSLIHAHQITLNEFIRYPFFPLNGELLFVPGLLVNTISAQLVPWICLLTLTIGCFSEAQKHFPDRPGTKWALAFGLTGSLVLLANQLMTTL
ncbi:MAG: arnT, partial [Devosia sp.]|nr:arnT [Devosia sp.]